MTTETQTQANRANAQLSTGPTTPEGKAIASRNALTHGLTAKTVLLPGEDPAEYNAFKAGMLKDLEPYNTIQGALAQDLIDCQWRLRRVPVIEARILSADDPDTRALNNISLYAARMKRQYTATLKEFQQLHDAYRRDWNQRMEQAALIQKADQIEERPSTLAQNGFDFTVESVQRWMDRRDAKTDAQDIIHRYNCADDDDDYDYEEDFRDAA